MSLSGIVARGLLRSVLWPANLSTGGVTMESEFGTLSNRALRI